MVGMLTELFVLAINCQNQFHEISCRGIYNINRKLNKINTLKG